jgi:putative ABC transport system substrate-binding protein
VNPYDPLPHVFQAMQHAAESLKLVLSPFEVRNPNEFDTAFAQIAKARCDALLVQTDTLFAAHLVKIAQLALSYRLPSACRFPEFAESGGLIAYGPSVLEGFRRAPVFVGKILKGAKVADLPIEQASEFQLLVNMTTARALGLAIPQPLAARARLI